MKVPKHVVGTAKERLKSKSKALKELRLKHYSTAQQIGHKNYQIEKLCEDKKELVGQCRNLKRRYESLEKNSKTVSEARTTLVAQHADLTLSGPSSRLTCKTRFI